jgi:DNA repair photolyase
VSAVRDRPTDNPLNRFRAVGVEYEPGESPPPSSITIIEDHSRSVLSRNDSPDLDFRWSCNPYRGCLHACAYCLDGSTLVMLADSRTRAIADLKPGDDIIGTIEDGAYRRYVPTRVLDLWQTRKLAYRVTLDDGTELIASGDHRFLSERGWTYVTDAAHERRAFLSREDRLLGPDLLRGIASIEPLDVRTLYDITTGTGDFIANGVISHNCYARPTHEYLDLGAGTDFDTKIVVKREAPELLRAAFDKPSWQGELVMFSGVTDCYQPIEKDLELTRKCLEVCLEYRNPVAVISKSALVMRDVELLAELAREAGCCVSVSLAWVDDELARAIEPWASSPTKRLKVIEGLAKAGVPVGVMCAPVIPGLSDDQLVRVLERAREAGATHAGWTLLRLPGAVAGVFEERVRAAMPLAAGKIMNRVRDTRGGGDQVYDARFGVRGRGEGAYAAAIDAMFDATVKRLGYNARDRMGISAASRFQRPKRGQLSLF